MHQAELAGGGLFFGGLAVGLLPGDIAWFALPMVLIGMLLAFQPTLARAKRDDD